jgi:hypothetical protein
MTTLRPALIAAIFGDADKAHAAVETLIQNDFPMDRISVLHRAGGSGDDFLGIAYANEQERTRVWSERGALWGSLAGLLASISGLLFVPGVGVLLAAGPVVNAITGAALGAGLGAGTATASRLANALHRLGIPEAQLQTLHQAIMDGKTVILAHADEGQGALDKRLRWQGAEDVLLLAGGA